MAKFNLDDANYDDSPQQLPQNPYAPSQLPRGMDVDMNGRPFSPFTPRDNSADSAPRSPYQGTPSNPYAVSRNPPPYGSGNSAAELSAINTSLGFPNFNPVTGLNNDGSRPGSAPGGGSPRLSAQDFIRQYQQGNAATNGISPLYDAMRAAGYGNVSRFMYGANPSNNELSIDGQKFKVGVDDGNGGLKGWFFGGDDSAPGGYGGPGNPFDDPATKGYIDQLNSRIQQLQTPYQNPDMAPLLGYMRKYFEQLQQPVYSDQQRDVINTQTIDPLERQRSARKAQVLQQMANRGMGPHDGPTIQALQDVDRQFDQSRTSQQGQFAANEINLGRQNQQQAVDVGNAIASLQNGQFMQQDQRANQAVGLGRQVPDMAQDRLQRAIALLNGNTANPASMLSAQNAFQNSGMAQSQQDSQYWQSIMAQIAQTFGL